MRTQASTRSPLFHLWTKPPIGHPAWTHPNIRVMPNVDLADLSGGVPGFPDYSFEADYGWNRLVYAAKTVADWMEYMEWRQGTGTALSSGSPQEAATTCEGAFSIASFDTTKSYGGFRLFNHPSDVIPAPEFPDRADNGPWHSAGESEADDGCTLFGSTLAAEIQQRGLTTPERLCCDIRNTLVGPGPDIRSMHYVGAYGRGIYDTITEYLKYDYLQLGWSADTDPAGPLSLLWGPDYESRKAFSDYMAFAAACGFSVIPDASFECDTPVNADWTRFWNGMMDTTAAACAAAAYTPLISYLRVPLFGVFDKAFCAGAGAGLSRPLFTHPQTSERWRSTWSAFTGHEGRPCLYPEYDTGLSPANASLTDRWLLSVTVTLRALRESVEYLREDVRPAALRLCPYIPQPGYYANGIRVTDAAFYRLIRILLDNGTFEFILGDSQTPVINFDHVVEVVDNVQRWFRHGHTSRVHDPPRQPGDVRFNEETR